MKIQLNINNHRFLMFLLYGSFAPFIKANEESATITREAEFIALVRVLERYF